MSPIRRRFQVLRDKGERALVLFVTAGDPSLDDLPAILGALEEGGADLIEVGIPFSDPIADGPTIQASSQRALERGVTPTAILDVLAGIRLGIPLVAMGYYNTLLRGGLETSADKLARAGVAGTIVSDLTPEEAADWIAVSRTRGLDNIFLVAPTSTPERIEAACKNASGFVYAVSRTGVTGAGVELPPDVPALLARIRSHTDLPVCVGFGISVPEHVRQVCKVADGAVVGSRLVQLLHERWQAGKGRRELVDWVRGMKAACQ
jgi:tryptophan synthase alpha chain